MATIKFTCHSCGKESEFNTQGTSVMLLDDTTPRPVTYVPNCTHCGKQCSVTVSQPE
jgi:transcription elongation factor Elf1